MSKTIRVGIIAFAVMLIFGFMHANTYAETKKLTDEFYVISETYGEIAPGITDKRVIINTAAGDQQNILYLCEIDPSVKSVEILAGFPDYDTKKLNKMDTATNQALAAEKATGKNVVAAFNNNGFSMTDGTVSGTLIMNGKTISGVNGEAYFGVTADGTPMIGTLDSSAFSVLKEAVGGFRVLVKDGVFLNLRPAGAYGSDDDTTRNAVGIKEDGKIIYMVMEGKCNITSKGIDTYDIAEVMVGLGCVDVMQPDGGGSCTYAIQRPGSDKLVVENDPTYGVERKVSATVLLTSSAKQGASKLTKCQKNGHTYVKTNSTVKCGVCGTSSAVSEFSGLTTDKASGKKMYYINGVFQTGWTPVDKEMYYFNSKGLSETVKVKTTKASECNNNGYTLYRCEKATAADGKEFKLPNALMAPGHSYNSKKICERCGWKEIPLSECTVKTEKASYAYTGEPIEPKVVITARGKKLNSYYDYKVIGYENNVEYGTGKVYINTNFHNGTDLVYNSSSLERYDEPYVVEFQIKPAAVTNLKAKTMGTGSVKLTWTKTADAAGYQITKYNAAKGKWELKKTISKPGTVTWTFKGLNAGKVHQYRVIATAKNADGKVVKSDFKAVKAATKPMQVQKVKLTKGKKGVLNVKWNKRECTGYQIRYSTNKNFKSYKQVNVVGKAKTTKQFKKLKSGKKYYVKVRAYTTVNNVKTFGNWSAAKNIKIK